MISFSLRVSAWNPLLNTTRRGFLFGEPGGIHPNGPEYASLWIRWTCEILPFQSEGDPLSRNRERGFFSVSTLLAIQLFALPDRPVDAPAECDIALSRFAVSHNTQLLPATPYIPPSSLHYRYALLVLDSHTHEGACERLGVTLRQAKRWRENLRQCAQRFFGRRVRYEVVARWCVERLPDTFSRGIFTPSMDGAGVFFPPTMKSKNSA